ncbi:MAG: hypothetical protein GC186_16490 [Rhodobacteraceae bacterium]|nr:hypothetical protein [Paracoccaceae bacterium]
MQIYTKMPTPGSIGAGQTASTKLILGYTHNRIDIRCNAQIAAAPKDLAAADWTTVFGDIRIIVNGQTKIEIAAKDAVARAQFFGYVLQNGTLPIDLTMPFLKLPGDAQVSGYGTTGVATMIIEMDINAGQTVNSLEVYSLQTGPSNWGHHLEIQRFSQNIGVVGKVEIADLPKTAGLVMTAFHFTTANISAMDVLSNQLPLLQTDASTRANALMCAGRIAQAGYTSWDFLDRNMVADSVAMQVQDFRVRPTFTAAGNFYLITEGIASF